jgi:predicted nucleotidyltransferase
MDRSEAIEKVRRYRELLVRHLNFEKMILYGSHAKGTASDDSDIDVAVVVERAADDYFEDTPLLWRLRAEIDSRIEPVLVERTNDASGFLEEISRNGIEI